MIDMNKITELDFKSMFIGRLLGKGYSRDVYEFPILPNTVIKIERDNGFQNATEWLISEEMKHTLDSKYIAQCLFISPSGKVLIQEYAEDITAMDMDAFLNMNIPNFLTDVKIENVGKTVDGRIVFRDYGLSLLTKNYKLENVKTKINIGEEIDYE